MQRSAPFGTALPELLERSTELATLSGLLERVAGDSSGSMCLISGEAGVGKTALVKSFCRLHESSRILWGACEPLFTPRPLGPLADIAAMAGGELSRIAERWARPYEVASALLNELRDKPAAIVVLEDMQWADEATLDVVRLLSRRVESSSALVIATYRDDELGTVHPLRFLIGEMPRHASVCRIKLQGLSAAAVAGMARDAGVDADELYRKTAGNPFFVTEALASAADEEIPSTVRDAVLARAARLSPDARSLLDTVAVAPPLADLWLLETVSPAQLSALGECLDSGMLHRQNGSVSFRHELARLAIEESIAPDRALHLHRETLRALMTPPYGSPDVTRLAHHAEAANDPDATLRFARAAGERAASLGAHREAAAQFKRALRFADLLAARDHADVLQLLAQEYLHINNADQAIIEEERAVELYRSVGDEVNRADALRRLSRLFSCGGRAAEAEAPIRQALDILEKLPEGRELSLAYAGLVGFHMNRDDGAGTIEVARRALEVAERVGDTETVLHTLNSLGTTEILMGDPRGKEKLLRSLDMAQELAMDEHVGRVYINLGEALLKSRSYEGLVDFLSQGVDFCIEHGLELWRMWVLCSLARALMDRGDWSQAIEVAETVLHGERGSLTRVHALPIIAVIRARRGDPDVWPLLDEAKAMADEADELQFSVPVSLARAEAAWLEGRNKAVLDETDQAYRRAMAMDSWWMVGEMACWRRRVGVREDPHPKLPERYGAELRGDWSKAAARWTAVGCDYEAALALVGAEDDDLLRQSLVKLQRLGAKAAAAVVARKLRARGARGIARGPRPTTQRNPGQLTARELEVLDLVSAGMRNAEIASRLFLTPKTVDHHVSAILRKLAVDSRAQAAREATRLGLLN